MDQRKPSVFTPLLRRFTNERDRELEETRRLYAWVKAAQDAFTETPITVGARVYEIFEHLPEIVVEPLSFVLARLVEEQDVIWELPPPAFERMDLQEFVEYRNLLHAKQYFFVNQAPLLEVLHDALVVAVAGIASVLPEVETPSPFTIPLIYTLPNPRETVQSIFNALGDPADQDRGLFKHIAPVLWRNLSVVSGRDPYDVKSKKPFKHADDSTMPLDQMVEQYLAGTAFPHLLMTPVPLKLTYEDRFNHMHILAGSGVGKTVLLENLLVHDLQSDDPPSIVVFDPHSDLINKLLKSTLIDKIDDADKLIYLNPRDIEYPAALNIFALNKERMAGYDEATREQVTAGVIDTYEYLFGGFGIDLTGKQQVLFRNVCRLLISLPDTMGRNATILDMLKIMSDATPYQAAIAALPDIPRDFFEKDFREKGFVQTKEQIRYRLQAIIENPTMGRLFTATETKVDLFGALNNGSLVLCDTAKDFLKGSSADYGRLLLSLVLQAVMERSVIPADERKPAFIIIDEAASFFSKDVNDLLAEARKYKVGLVLAHQFLDQASTSLKSSLASNTGTKFCAGVSAGDAAYMAREMRTTPDFITKQPRLHFAAHIRNVTPHAVSIPVKVGVIDALPTLPADELHDRILMNRWRVSLEVPGAEQGNRWAEEIIAEAEAMFATPGAGPASARPPPQRPPPHPAAGESADEW